MNKKLTTALLLSAALFAGSCKKTNDQKLDTNPLPTAKAEHGMGIIVDQKIPTNIPRANLDEMRSRLIQAGYLNKLKVNGTLPASVILSHPGIGDQGTTNTCVSWSIGYAMAGTLNNEFPIGLTTYRSPWYIYQINHTATGVCADNGMSSGADGMNIFQNNGIPPSSYDPVFGNFCSYNPTGDVTDNAGLDKIPSYYSVANITDIKTALSMRLPVEMTFNVYSNFQNAFNTHTKYSAATGSSLGTLLGGHAVCIIGYDDSKNAVLIQNSWGTGGGDSTYPGCMWIDYNVFTNTSVLRELYVANPPLKPLAINGIKYIAWSANGSSSGNITALPGTLVHVTVSAYGSSTKSHVTNFMLTGATLSGPMGNNLYVSNGSTTQSFTMPSTGTVSWSGYFSENDTTGFGNIAPY
jgi:hypothetical protein